MYINKFILFIMIVIFSLSLISCSSLRKKMINDRLNSLNSSDDNKIADECFDKIIGCIENKDKEGLKEIFSANALKEAKDIDNGINYIMDFYKGKMQARSEVTMSREDSSEDGRRTTELKCMYTVTTDEDTYIVFFINQKVDTKNSDDIGVSMIQVIKKSDRVNEFDGGGNKTRCTGIYRPDSINE